MKVYLALEYYNNGEDYEDFYDRNSMIGAYQSLEGARSAIDRHIEDVHNAAIGIGTSDERLPGIHTIIDEDTDPGPVPYKALLLEHEYVSVCRTYQYYTLEVTVYD